MVDPPKKRKKNVAFLTQDSGFIPSKVKVTEPLQIQTVSLSAGDWHTVGLKADGTVVAVGRNNFGQCDVDSWILATP